MEISRPFFSIILPTYNRADMLPLAIQSVLNQTFDDFELVISNGGSTDQTCASVRAFNDRRIRYFESAERLSMAENYEFALGKAMGEYIIFFSDDDAFVPTMLERVRKLLIERNAQMIVFPFAYYCPDGNPEEGAGPNSLVLSSFTSNVTQVRSTDDIKRMSGRFGLSDEVDDNSLVRPLIGNVVFGRSILETLLTRVPSLFATIPVDGYFIGLVLTVIDEYYVLDCPLLAWSKWKENASASNLSDLRQHYERLLDGKTLERVPLKFALPMNCAANAILQATRDVGSIRTVPVDWKWYFVKMFEYLIYLDAEGIETANEREELMSVLKGQPSDIQAFFSNATAESSFMRRQTIKRKLRPVINIAKRARRALERINGYNGGTSQKSIINGRRNGFTNVLESAQFLDSRLLPTNDHDSNCTSHL